MVFLTNWPILNKWFIKQVSHETYSDKIVIVAFDLGVGANYCSLVHMDDSMQYIWSYTLRWKVWHKTLRKDNTNNIHVLDQITRGKNGALGFVSWYGPIRKTWQFNNEIASTTGTNHGEVHPTIQLCEGFARPNDKNGKGPPPPPLPRLFKGFNLLLLSNTSESWDNGPLKSNTNTENSKRTGPGDVTDQQLSYYRACLVKMKSIEMVVGDHYL